MASHSVAVAASEAAPWVERLARLGFAAKGVLYLTVGVMSARSAAGAGGRTVTDSHDAMSALDGTFGRPLLAVIAIALAGHGLWLGISALADTDDRGRDAGGIARRIGAGICGLVHLALAYTAVSFALWSSAGRGQDEQTRHWTARLLESPGGSVLVWIVALSVGGYGIYQLVCAWRAKLDDRLDLDRRRGILIAICRFGIAARGIVFIAIGVLFVRAAVSRDAAEAGGPGDSMQQLFAFGRAPFALIATGLAAYGVYQLVEARYRRVRATSNNVTSPRGGT